MNEGKTEGVVAFGLDKPTLSQFEELVETLGVTKSELARRAYMAGLPTAVAKLKKERMQRAQSAMTKLSALSLQALHVLRIRQGCAAGVS